MSIIIQIHTALGIGALITGAWNLLRAKGTKRHRQVGWIYSGAMYGLLFTFEVFGGFGVFHVLSIVSGLILTMALYFPIRRERHPHWMAHHYFWISYS